MSYHCFSRKLVKAKKEHRCIWCCLPTIVGSYYLREHSVYDGSFQNVAWHEACRADSDRWFADTHEEEFVSGNDMPFHGLYLIEVVQLREPTP